MLFVRISLSASLVGMYPRSVMGTLTLYYIPSCWVRQAIYLGWNPLFCSVVRSDLVE